MSDIIFLLDKIIEIEGAYVNNVADPGGQTKYGISKRSYPNIDIRTLTVDAAKEIYRRDFLVPANIAAIQDQDLAWSVFKSVVNRGVYQGIKDLQDACNRAGAGLVVDGISGVKTAEFLNAKPRLALALFKLKMAEVYTQICLVKKSQSVFLLGWLNRTLFL